MCRALKLSNYSIDSISRSWDSCHVVETSQLPSLRSSHSNNKDFGCLNIGWKQNIVTRLLAPPQPILQCLYTVWACWCSRRRRSKKRKLSAASQGHGHERTTECRPYRVTLETAMLLTLHVSRRRQQGLCLTPLHSLWQWQWDMEQPHTKYLFDVVSPSVFVFKLHS